MKLFDPHIHMTSRTTLDYEAMAGAGIVAVVEPSFWMGQPRTHVGSFEDYFASLLGWERFRASQFGIRHFCTLSLNPKEANSARIAQGVIELLPRYLSKDGVVAVGEIGYDDMTSEEDKYFAAQLELAIRFDLPVLIHTPHRDKKRGAERVRASHVGDAAGSCVGAMRKIHHAAGAREVGFPEERALIDHNTEETLPLVLESACWAGHSIYPFTKMDEPRMVALVKRYGAERILINSAADWGVSDPLKVPKTVVASHARNLVIKAGAQTLTGKFNNPNTGPAYVGTVTASIAVGLWDRLRAGSRPVGDEADRSVPAMVLAATDLAAGREIVIEDFLKGEELSVLALTDGESAAREDALRAVIAETDELTGLFNTRGFAIAANRLFGQAVRYDRAASVLMIDSDNLKGVNDAHGHLFGSRALVEAAAVIRGSAVNQDGRSNGLTAPHAASSPWWAWLFDLKPVWFYQQSFAGDTTASIYDAGNLVAWWLSVPAIAFVAWQMVERASRTLTALLPPLSRISPPRHNQGLLGT